MFKRAIFPILCSICLSGHSQQAGTSFAPDTDNRQWLPGYAAEFSVAHSHYPELKDATFIVKVKDIRTVMAARPSFGSCFKKKEKRIYYLFVDTLFNGHKGLFYDLSRSARIGLIGHELSHIAVYNHKNFFGLMGYGFVYLLCKRKIEHRTDEIAIRHGLFPQLYDYALIAFDSSVVGDKYCRYKRKHYYTPGQLKEIENKIKDESCH